MNKILAIVVLSLLASGLAIVRQEPPPAAPSQDVEAEAKALLNDKSQPWWNDHRLKSSKGAQSYSMVPSHDLGGRVDPPIFTPQMPPKLAYWLMKGGKPPEGHPFAGHPFVMLDVRRVSECMAESFQGTLNVPGAQIEKSLEDGELSKLDRQAVIVAFGSRWPHYELISKLKGAKFTTVYAMEGLQGWKAAGLPVQADEKMAKLLKIIDSEPHRGTIAPIPEPAQLQPIAGIDALALKVIIDAGVDPLCVFVGSRVTYEDGHVPGAVYIPVTELEAKLAKTDKNRLIVVLCGCCQGLRGGPSELGVDKLAELGFKRVLHLNGHMYAWKTAGLPVETEESPFRK